MRLFSGRLQHQLVIPWTLLCIVSTVVPAIVSIALISRNLEHRASDQAEQVSQVIANTDFALNPAILDRLKTVIGADVVTFTAQGEVLTTTLNSEADQELRDAVIQASAAADAAGAGGFATKSFQIRNAPFIAGYRVFPGRRDTLVAVVLPTTEMVETRSALTRTIVLTAVLILIAMSVASQFVARRISAPLEKLLHLSGEVARGNRSVRVEVRGDDEIALLSTGYNEMVSQLQESEERLVRSEKLAVAGLLAARVAHDIRNPLSSIKMQAQLLRTRLKDSPENQGMLQLVLREIDRVELVVRGLLDLASPGDLRLQPSDVNETIREILALIEARLKHLKIETVAELSENLPPVMLDRSRFIQALLNITSNAEEAMPTGGTLRLGTSRRGDSVAVEVVDTGEGIAPDVRERLFNAFVTTKADGIGLGLVNARSIIERHGGTITLSSDGSGTRATIILPAGANG